MEEVAEAPTIGSTLKNENNKELTLDEKIKIKFSFNDKNILINITRNEITPKEYEVLLSLEQLHKINIFFANFENIEEIVEWIINSIQQKVSKINFNNNKCYIQIIDPINKKQFDLILKLKEKDMNSRITNLESIILIQNNKIKELENKIKTFEDKIKEYEPMFEEYIIKKKETALFFSTSDILNVEEKNLLLKWLPKKPNKIILLLNSNIDGDSINSFKQKVENKFPTLAIIETTKGRKFGGYTTQIWKNGETKDNNAFVFSFVTKKKYEIKEPQHAIGLITGEKQNRWWGFGYSNNAIVIRNNSKSTNDNYVDNQTYNIQEKNELNGGEHNFTVKSYEIYLID